MRIELAIVCLFASLGCVYAAHPSEVFSANRAQILATRVSVHGGIVYSVCRGVFEDESTIEEEIVKGGTELQATAQLLIGIRIQDLAWPKALGTATRVVLQDLLAQVLDVKTTISGLTTVYSEREGDVWVCVMALPEGEAGKVPRVSFEEARQMLLQEGVVSRAEGKALDALIALRGTLGDMPAAVDRGPWEGALAAATFGAPRLAALPRLAGRYPLGSAEMPTDADFAKGNDAFGKGDLEAAYAAFLASAGRAWTFDALNMAGNVARRLPGHEAEAVALLLHAAYLKPSSPYPWVHLAFVASREGDLALAGRCCAKAEALGAGDAWVREQVAAVRKTLAPPAPTQEAPSREAKAEQEEAHP